MLRISTPGRVCLFGEHQDYLHLPVVPCAISLRITIDARHCNEAIIRVHLPDIGSEDVFPIGEMIPYVAERDYLRSTVNVLLKHGYTFSRGVECTVRGTIPINAGTSSSSALIVSWVNVLTRLSDQRLALPAKDIAILAHAAEVLEFGEPGGMMDHFSTAFGGILAIDFEPEIEVERFDIHLGSFILGDSGEPKDTKGILARVKNRVLEASARLSEHHPEFSLHTADEETIHHYGDELSRDERELLYGTLRNRDITREARRMLSHSTLDHAALGKLLSEHQGVLRTVLRISTPKIDRMLTAAIEAGAYGGKINGSGGGGCMFVYAPDDPLRVARAIAEQGGKAYVVHPDEGTRTESVEVRV
jgi:galactokinase